MKGVTRNHTLVNRIKKWIYLALVYLCVIGKTFFCRKYSRANYLHILCVLCYKLSWSTNGVKMGSSKHWLVLPHAKKMRVALCPFGHLCCQASFSFVSLKLPELPSNKHGTTSVLSSELLISHFLSPPLFFPRVIFHPTSSLDLYLFKWELADIGFCILSTCFGEYLSFHDHPYSPSSVQFPLLLSYLFAISPLLLLHLHLSLSIRFLLFLQGHSPAFGGRCSCKMGESNWNVSEKRGWDLLSCGVPHEDRNKWESQQMWNGDQLFETNL